MLLVSREAGHGEAGEVALHVGDEGRNSGGREALDDALQGDGLAGAGRSGDQAVAVGPAELEALGVAAAACGSDEDASTRSVGQAFSLAQSPSHA